MAQSDSELVLGPIRKREDVERGGRVRHAIDMAGLKVAFIAERLNVTPDAVGNWMSGRTGISPPNLRRLANLLGVSASYLAFGNEDDARSANRKTIQAEPILLLGVHGPDLSDEAMASIAEFIRFKIHEEEQERLQ